MKGFIHFELHISIRDDARITRIEAPQVIKYVVQELQVTRASLEVIKIDVEGLTSLTEDYYAGYGHLIIHTDDLDLGIRVMEALRQADLGLTTMLNHIFTADDFHGMSFHQPTLESV